MAMGKRQREQQVSMWVSHEQLPRSKGHAFYEAVNQVLDGHGFDDWVEQACRSFYADQIGRPGLAPGIYFRCLLVGYFEGIDSERGIGWRCGDSLSLRQFLGLSLTEGPPDHSTLSRTRRLIDLETHVRVFQWMLKVLAYRDLLKGKTAGIDATTLEANAALKSIVRRDSGQSYDEFLTRLAIESGIETPTRQDLAKLDKSRKKKGNNKDWEHPHDPDARIAKMKDGRTHLAHKMEHAVDFNTGAVLAVTVQGADQGDTTTWRQTFEQACTNVNVVKEDPVTADPVHDSTLEEWVMDKGYHSKAMCTDLLEIGTRGYISEPNRGRRKWKGEEQARDAVYGNRRRIKGNRGKALMRQRGELLERSFAHVLTTGGMRRVHLRGSQNILKRLLIQVAGFNLSLLMRQMLGHGKPRARPGRRELSSALYCPAHTLILAAMALFHAVKTKVSLARQQIRRPSAIHHRASA